MEPSGTPPVVMSTTASDSEDEQIDLSEPQNLVVAWFEVNGFWHPCLLSDHSCHDSFTPWCVPSSTLILSIHLLRVPSIHQLLILSLLQPEAIANWCSALLAGDAPLNGESPALECRLAYGATDVVCCSLRHGERSGHHLSQSLCDCGSSR